MRAAAQARPELVAQLVPAPFSLDFDRVIRERLPRASWAALIHWSIRGQLAGQYTDDLAPGSRSEW